MRTQRIAVSVVTQIEAQHGALFVGGQTLHFDVLNCRRRQNTARQFQCLFQCRFAVQFINRGTTHHAFDRDLSAYRWYEQCVAVLEAAGLPTNAMEEQVIGIDFFDERVAAIVL